VHKPRKDAETHFQFADKPDKGDETVVRPSSQHNNMGLYKDNVMENSEEVVDPNEPTTKKPLTTVTNVDLEHRKKDFGSQFEMTDKSPAGKRSTDQDKKVDQNRAKVIQGLNASWHMYDEDPEAGKKENLFRQGNVGARKNADARHWGFEPED
jgi:hypothetical protein